MSQTHYGSNSIFRNTVKLETLPVSLEARFSYIQCNFLSGVTMSQWFQLGNHGGSCQVVMFCSIYILYIELRLRTLCSNALS